MIEITVHPCYGSQIAIPYNVCCIKKIENASLSDPVLQIGYKSDIKAVQSSISAKCSQSKTTNGTVFSISLSADIEDGGDDIQEYIYKIGNNDHIVLLKTYDGNYFLCYTLPNSLKIESSVSIKETKSRQISVSLKSNSEFIPITF